jgi:hypothetical protein
MSSGSLNSDFLGSGGGATDASGERINMDAMNQEAWNNRRDRMDKAFLKSLGNGSINLPVTPIEALRSNPKGVQAGWDRFLERGNGSDRFEIGLNSNTTQAGIEPNNHWIGPTLIGLGSQTIGKPFSLGGIATKGTSVASTVLRKTLPYSSPTIKRITTTVLGRASSTSVLGGALGRLVPGVGWGWTLFDATMWGLQNGQYNDFKSNTEFNNPNIIVGPKW